MSDSNNFINHLKNLKSKINNHNASLLVGSGLSKNVSELFPTWSELLFDMAKEMFEVNVRNEYSILEAAKNSADLQPYQQYLEERLKYYITDVGYLQLVSNYIKRNGYREIVDVYIENRIPHVVTKENKKYIKWRQGGKVREDAITNGQFDIHINLLEMPWNNIYTTNYDNLLEACIKQEIKKDLTDKISQLKQQTERYENILKTATENLDLIEKKITDLEKEKVTSLMISKSRENGENINLFNYGTSGDNQNCDEALSDLKKEKIKTAIEKNSSAHIVNNSLKKIINLQSVTDDCLSVVTNSSELALKRNKNIIKLHGSLRTAQDADFGFDNDGHKHYVISKEDYESYPRTHEAFTQLMRISLLQESFCLIGFSGIDPNFLAWISWVRDILHKRKINKDTDAQIKIYLIDISRELVSDERKLFYNNHRVAYIPILEDTCVSFLETTTNRKINSKSEKEVLTLLTAYLNDGMDFFKPQVALELLEHEDYQKLWSDLRSSEMKKEHLPEILSKAIAIECLSKKVRIPSVNFAYSHNKHSILTSSKFYYDSTQSTDEKNNLFRLLLVALNHQFLPYGIYNHDDILDTIAKSIDDEKLLNSFWIIQLKNSLWKNDKEEIELSLKRNIIDTETEQEVYYLKALHAAFNLDFEELKDHLEKWPAMEHWILKKAGLISFFDVNRAIKQILSHTQTSYQEQLYSWHLLSYFKEADFRNKKENTLREKIKKIESEGLKTIDENSDYLIKEISNEKNDLKPYGDGKFSVNYGFSMSNTSPALQSLQYFGILMESGFPLTVGHVHFENHKKVYPLIKYWFKSLLSNLN